jgi:hypothetical protein
MMKEFCTMRYICILALIALGLGCGEQPAPETTDSTTVVTPTIDSTVVPPVDTTVVVDTAAVVDSAAVVIDSAAVAPAPTGTTL